MNESEFQFYHSSIYYSTKTSLTNKIIEKLQHLEKLRTFVSFKEEVAIDEIIDDLKELKKIKLGE